MFSKEIFDNKYISRTLELRPKLIFFQSSINSYPSIIKKEEVIGELSFCLLEEAQCKPGRMATQDTAATAAEIVTGGQYPDYDNDTGEYKI